MERVRLLGKRIQDVPVRLLGLFEMSLLVNADGEGQRVAKAQPGDPPDVIGHGAPPLQGAARSIG